MPLRCGIIGLPNVGKSTLFNALTASSAVADNYPFATIEPNIGVAEVPDSRLEAIAPLAQAESITRSTVEFVDVAGLVAGAAEGEGLGNQFLAKIREVDAVAHVVRCFENPEVTHVSGGIDPQRDIEVVNLELALADIATVDRALERNRRLARAGDKDAQAVVTLLEDVAAHLVRGELLRTAAAADLHLLTAKPTMYIANVGEREDSTAATAVVRQIAEAEGAGFVPIAATLEAEIVELPEKDRADFLADIGETTSGLERLVKAAYELLGLETFFTIANKKVEAWAIPVGSNAARAAGLIHTDFEQRFVRAEVTSFNDFVEYGGDHGSKEAGTRRLEGRDYQVADGDVITFRINPG